MLLKFFSLFSVVRGYNIFVVVIAQYLTSIYILAYYKPFKEVLLDVNLFLIVLASAMVIASGYIINNFYDSEKDVINRPEKAKLDQLVSQNTKLSFYFILNILAVLVASYVSFRATLFFSLYIFGIWFYSHKLKRLPIIGNITSSILTITPFFAVFIYYKNFETVIFLHAMFLFLIIAMRELIKDLENITGDLALNYKTIPIVYGEKLAKQLLTFFSGLAILPIILIITKYNVGYMRYYFYIVLVFIGLFNVILIKSRFKKHYNFLHNLLKGIILLGVLCIILINPELILNKIL